MKNMFIPFPKSLFYILLFILYSCNSSTETTEENKTHLEVYDVSCTEVWLQLKVDRISLPAGGVVRIEGIKEIPVTITTNDTLLFFDSLEVNREYRFKVILQNPGQTLTTNEATARTLDTTSHNFTWQTFEFGEFGSSVLYDVAIIDENNIWAVGEIYVKDSLGNPDPKRYNAVHWNGTTWELKRIMFPSVCGSTNLTPYAAKTVFAFNNGEIWITSSGDKIVILKENNQIDRFCLPSSVSMSINKLWGTSSNDLYAVGNGGNIAHWNGSSWTKIESGTSLDIYDIWGDYNEKSKNWEILAVASNISTAIGSKILSIQNSKVSELSNSGLPWSLISLWFISGIKYISVGDGVYQTISPKEQWLRQPGLPPLYTTSISGTAINDIVVGGAYWNLLHYNGINWQSYFPFTSGSFTSVTLKNDRLIAVGGASGKAIIVIGIR